MIAIDKQAHFWWGWAISATLFGVIGALAVVPAVVFGALKEYWDSKGHGTPDKMDFTATALGGVAGVFCCAVLQHLTEMFTGG